MIRESKNIHLLYLGKTTFILCSRIFSFVMSFYILAQTNSSIQFSVSLAINYLPQILMSPFAGIISDVFSKKRLIITSGIFGFLSSFIPIVFGFSIYGIYITIFVLSLVSALYTVSLDSTIPFAMPNKSSQKLRRVASGMQMITSISGVISPVLGGFLVNLLPLTTLLIGNSVLFLVSSACAFFLVISTEPQSTKKQKSANISLIASMKYILKTPWALRIAVTECALNFAMAFGVLSVFQIVVMNQWRLSSEHFGLFNSMDALGAFVTLVIYRRFHIKTSEETFPQPLLFMYSAIIVGCAINIWRSNYIAIFASFIILCLLQIVKGSLGALINVSIVSTKQFYTPASLLGRVIGSMNAISSAMIPLGLILSGVINQYVPNYMLTMLSGVFMLLFLIISSLAFRYVPGLSSNINTQKGG